MSPASIQDGQCSALGDEAMKLQRPADGITAAIVASPDHYRAKRRGLAWESACHSAVKGPFGSETRKEGQGQRQIRRVVRSSKWTGDRDGRIVRN